MQYQTVFDIATVGYKSWSFPAFGLLFIAIGAVLAASRKRFPGWWSWNARASNVFAFFFLGFAVLWTLIALVSTYGEYLYLMTAVTNRNASVIEGIVINFTPMPISGHAMEKFCVSNACFEYSDFAIVGGFNNTSSHGGPIRGGLPVRVTYVGNSILKLEIAK